MCQRIDYYKRDKELLGSFEPKGTIVGLAVNDIVKLYIVKMDNPEDVLSEYSCVVIHDSCLRVV
jgi:hypothetical protein